MSATRTIISTFVSILLLLMFNACANLAPSGVSSSDSEIIRVSTSPLQWQRERGPFFKTADEAQNYVKNLNLGGFSDWRLPTREEMMDFYYAFDFGSAEASKLGISIEGYYWAEEDDGAVHAGSWSDGEICEITRNYRESSRGAYVRAVRQ